MCVCVWGGGEGGGVKVCVYGVGGVYKRVCVGRGVYVRMCVRGGSVCEDVCECMWGGGGECI